MKAIHTFALALSLSAPMLATASETPLPFGISPSGDSLFVATAGEVILTFLSSEADYSSDLFLQGGAGSIFNNKTVATGSQFSLGNFEAGTTLTFGLLVNNIGATFFNGPASLNPDNVIHAAYSSVIGNTITIGFEDLFGGGDLDYNDLVFSLTNVYAATTPVSPVSEPETYAMFMAGLGLMGWASKRREQK
jgi:hypothetical protein